MTTFALMLKPIRRGWAVSLTNGEEIARFVGPGARWRAEHYIVRVSVAGSAGGQR
jgi:hypothetical protein